ncbi:peptidase inhibitor family I36 protein [Hamadaea sp. NPDC050747]|uniref:peptidase inhibitor family I36 protein n=1 Tax=Hamadaea sp. NPDC050747 TaxID=3155789 RepID=UPI0033D4A869
MTPRITRRILAVVLILAATVAGTVQPATASGITELQAEINTYLAANPGGTQINATDISYSGGAFIVTLGRTTSLSLAADCPAGWFCFYDATDYNGARGRLSSCGWQDLAQWNWNDRVVSAYYNTQKSGYVDFLDHAAGYTSHGHDTKLFTISASSPGLRLVPYPYRADHVNYHC